LDFPSVLRSNRLSSNQARRCPCSTVAGCETYARAAARSAAGDSGTAPASLSPRRAAPGRSLTHQPPISRRDRKIDSFNNTRRQRLTSGRRSDDELLGRQSACNQLCKSFTVTLLTPTIPLRCMTASLTRHNPSAYSFDELHSAGSSVRLRLDADPLPAALFASAASSTGTFSAPSSFLLRSALRLIMCPSGSRK